MKKKPMEAVRGKYRLDEINMNILDELNANSRMHLPELSRRVGLASSNSVYQRMKDMEAAGIIKGYTIDINWDLIDLKGGKG